MCRSRARGSRNGQEEASAPGVAERRGVVSGPHARYCRRTLREAPTQRPSTMEARAGLRAQSRAQWGGGFKASRSGGGCVAVAVSLSRQRQSTRNRGKRELARAGRRCRGLARSRRRAQSRRCSGPTDASSGVAERASVRRAPACVVVGEARARRVGSDEGTTWRHSPPPCRAGVRRNLG
jgi:hypothetical protein